MYKQHLFQRKLPSSRLSIASASLLLLLCAKSGDAALITVPPPIVDTEPPTNLTVPADSIFSATRPVITLDMATQFATSSVTATDSTAAGAPSTDITGNIAGQLGPLGPGRHTITWTATDLGNNELKTTQTIDVLPEVNFAVDQTVGEGNTNVTVTAYLSGKAPVYPVTIGYTVSGTATGGGVDHTASDGTITIADGETSGSTAAFTIVNDGLGDAGETIVFTISSLSAGNVIPLAECITLHCKTAHTITIAEVDPTSPDTIAATNLTPIISIAATQGSSITPTHNITADGGVVTLTADVRDPNGDAISGYDWSASDNALTPTEGTTNNTFKFDPAGLAPGIYTARLTARDSYNGSSTREILLRLYATTPTLSSTDDSDDDGLVDNAANEGIQDSDGDGIPNYLDAVSNPSWLQGWDLLTYKADLKRSDSFVSGPITFSWELDKGATTITSNRVYYPLLLATEPGLNLSIGPVAFSNGSNYGRVNTDAASLYFGSALDSSLISADGQVVDVEISNLGTTGESVHLVIPQAAPLPPGSPKFKVMSSAHTWQDFVNDGTAGSLLYVTNKNSDAYCPDPGDSSYNSVTTGSSALSGGISCIEVVVKDGGVNDYDGEANGIIHLMGAPFIVSTATSNTTTTPPEFSGTAEGSVEDLKKINLTQGGGGLGSTGLWGVVGLLLAYRLRRR